MDRNIEFKKELKKAAMKILEERMEASKQAMIRSKEATESEEKSSMGDKYETSRAMGHIDSDLHAKNYENARKQFEAIQMISADTSLKAVKPGAFVQCNDISYFILTGLGKVEYEGRTIHFISASSPAAIAMMNLVSGNDFTLNGISHVIEEVF